MHIRNNATFIQKEFDVIELLLDEVVPTHNPYVILILYWQGLFIWLGFLIPL